ncbi:TetR family transcriptional regulator [Aeromicrobium sp. S22]|uniref:TetR family transcriptional regulator n=1 Tax=Aeromicrobium sp. S22 TaxID=2662029 RepID=UPI00129EAF8B|nr:TetR family transcriptional regulator [Aeromicrobium sp. S22]
MKAKNSLNRELVVESALRIVDTSGLEALTVRKVADEFGVTPMALYWHFSNKEALLDAVGDAVVAGMGLPDPDLGLEGYLRDAMTALVDAMREHPHATPLVPHRLLMVEAGRDLTEMTLRKLVDEGFAIDKAAAVAHYALMMSMTLVVGEPGKETTVKPADRDEALAAKMSLLQSLPEDSYPLLRAAAPSMVNCADSDDYYGSAIDIFVAGVMAEARALPTS